MIIAAFGVLGLGYSLHLTRRATYAAIEAGQDADRALLVAERNAKAAIRSVVIAQETAERQLRAYASARMAETPQLEFGKELLGKMTWQNHGATPAYNFRFEIALRLADPRNPVLPELDPRRGSASVLNPGEMCSTNFGRTPLTLEEYRAVLDGRACRFFVYGWAAYDDAFGIRRTLKLRYELGGLRMKEIGCMMLSPEGNESD